MDTSGKAQDYKVALGLGAFLVGLACAAAILAKIGMFPKSEHLIVSAGTASAVGGCILLFVLPPLYHRIIALERRLIRLEGEQGNSRTPTEGDG